MSYTPINIYELFPEYIQYIDNYISDHPYLKILTRIFSKNIGYIQDIQFIEDDGIFDYFLKKTNELENLYDINNVPNDFIEYLGYLLNFTKFNNENIDNQRKRLKNLIYYYQRRGTTRSIEGIFREANIKFEFINQYQNIASTSYNGKLSFENCYIQNEKYHHEGSILLILKNVSNRENFEFIKYNVNDVIPLGFIVWYILQLYQTCKFNMNIYSYYPINYPQVNRLNYNYDMEWDWNNTWVFFNNSDFSFSSTQLNTMTTEITFT